MTNIFHVSIPLYRDREVTKREKEEEEEVYGAMLEPVDSDKKPRHWSGRSRTTPNRTKTTMLSI